MRIITLEEHVSFPEMTDRIQQGSQGGGGVQGGGARGAGPQGGGAFAGILPQVAGRIGDITGERLPGMDKNGISVQVLSVVGPGAHLLEPEKGPAFARDYNNLLAEKVAAYPDRFAAFAHLPMTAPEAAADELERTAREWNFRGAMISGLTRGEFLDHPRYAPLLQRAEALGLPLYLHPGPPPKLVFDAYYSDLPGTAGTLLSLSGWGWHAETALHILRLIISGTLDRYPRLQLIIGHMGEMLPMMMARCDDKFKVGTVAANSRTISETLREQVYVTTSGLFTWPPLQAALATFGIDRVMFSIDYPFSPMEEGRRFLDSLPLAQGDVEKLAHGNAERLLGL
jgi:predicted TIM-barrel fold metal-dependent hydrolase